ncbi:MAG: hypothetical protein ACRDLV_01690 [Solirubrobacteraceae bacterium]
MIRHLVVAALASFAARPAPVPTVHRAERAMLVAAQEYWERAPACGRPHLVMVANAPSDPTSDVQSDSWAYVLRDGPQSCRIYLVRRYWSFAYVLWSPASACRLLAHEYAHLLGFGDATVPHTLLSHTVDPTVRDAPCDLVARQVRNAGAL